VETLISIASIEGLLSPQPALTTIVITIVMRGE
jgi:hypothetical protein